VELSINNNQVSVIGYVEGIEDSNSVMDALNSVIENNKGGVISLILEDAFVIPSSLIGLLLETKENYEHKIEILAKNEKLITLMKRLNLIDVLNIKKI